MAVQIWVVAIIMFVVFAYAVYSLTPVYYLIETAMNTTAQNAITDPSALTAANNSLTISQYSWAWVVGLGAVAILVWAYLRPSHREWESYMD